MIVRHRCNAGHGYPPGKGGTTAMAWWHLAMCLLALLMPLRSHTTRLTSTAASSHLPRSWGGTIMPPLLAPPLPLPVVPLLLALWPCEVLGALPAPAAGRGSMLPVTWAAGRLGWLVPGGWLPGGALWGGWGHSNKPSSSVHALCMRSTVRVKGPTVWRGMDLSQLVLIACTRGWLKLT